MFTALTFDLAPFAPTAEDWQTYTPRLRVHGAKAHPNAVIVSRSLATNDFVLPFRLPTTPLVRNELLERGLISDVQAEQMLLAWHTWNTKLPSGRRRGFGLFSGGGVGKSHIFLALADALNATQARPTLIATINQLAIDELGDIAKKLGFEYAVGLTPGVPSVVTHAWLAHADRSADIATWTKTFPGAHSEPTIIYDEADLLAGDVKFTAIVEAMNKRYPQARVLFSSATVIGTKQALRPYSGRLFSADEFKELRTEKLLARLFRNGYAGALHLSMAHTTMTTVRAELQDCDYDGLNALHAVLQTLHDALDVRHANLLRAQDAFITNMRLSKNDADLARKETWHRIRADYAHVQFAVQNWAKAFLLDAKADSLVDHVRQAIQEGYACVVQLAQTNNASLGFGLANMDSTSARATFARIVTALTPNLDYAFSISSTTDKDDVVTTEVHIECIPIDDDPRLVETRNLLLRWMQGLTRRHNVLHALYTAFPNDEIAELTGRTKASFTSATGETQTLRLRSVRAAREAFRNGSAPIVVFSATASRALNLTDVGQPIKHFVFDPSANAAQTINALMRSCRSAAKFATTYVTLVSSAPADVMAMGALSGKLAHFGSVPTGAVNARLALIANHPYTTLLSQQGRKAIRDWSRTSPLATILSANLREELAKTTEAESHRAMFARTLALLALLPTSKANDGLADHIFYDIISRMPSSKGVAA